MLSEFSVEERRALVLIRTYEDIRRSKQYGYRAFPKINQEIKGNPVFKQFLTVTRWLNERGLLVTVKEEHWRGFVIFAFKFNEPRVPQPGQLRNEKLLMGYLQASPETEPDIRSSEELRNLYAKIIKPEILEEYPILQSLGLVGVVECLQKSQIPSSKHQKSVSKETLLDSGATGVSQ